ncbi:MAG: PAS domain S-box protein [Thermodesulfobacteriota bacterium]|nr:PAS domain S-box protein [Thermodesulfobacteriota bacterium]
MNSNLYRLLGEYPLETLLQTIPTGLFLIDTDKIIVYWNIEASRITGYAASEAVGRHCSFLYGDPCHIECGLFSETTPKPEIGLTCSFRHKDGRTIVLTKNVDLLRDNGGQIIGGIEAFVDISRLKELETSLRFEVEERTRELELEKSALRAVLDGMIDPVYICDETYHISFINRAMHDVIGDIGGKPCYEVIYQNSQVCESCPLPQVLKGQVVREEKALYHEGRTYEVIHSPYPSEKNITHKLGVCRDVTERIENKRRLQQANRELDAFVSTVSHDLRSPLTPLIGFAELLEERYAEQFDEVGHVCITEIKKTAEKMKNLLDDLLSLSQVGQLNLPIQPLDVTRIVEDVLLELADQVVASHAKIKIDKLPDMKIPESLLTDMFRNLLGNALKYAVEHDPRIEVSGYIFFERVRYKVVDHGPGVHLAEREAVFEPFKRGNNSTGSVGTGIGLATVAKIARIFGGNAWVEETPGGGATFIIDLPSSIKKLN